MLTEPLESFKVTLPEPPVIAPAPPARTISVSAARVMDPAEPPLVIFPAVLVKVPVPASSVIPFASPVIVLVLVRSTPLILNAPPAAVISPEVVTAHRRYGNGYRSC